MAISFTPMSGTYIKRFKMAASQAIAAGDPVVLNASGLVEIATTSSTAILGFAIEGVTSEATGDYYISVAVATSESIFKGTASTTVARSNIIVDYYDLGGSTGAFTVNLAASTNDIFQIVDIPGGMGETASLGTTVYVKVNARQVI